MGVPLSNYTVLKYIADGVEKRSANKESISMELALDSLREYSVFAFVLHDPQIHHEFHHFFEEQFENLHYSTGSH